MTSEVVHASEAGEPNRDEVVGRLRQISAALAEFGRSGCDVVDELLACVVSIPSGFSDGVPRRALLDAIGDVSDVHLHFERGPAAFELVRTSRSNLDFLGEPTGEPADAFDAEDLEAANRAWAGDVLAALSLPGQWGGRLSVHLGAPLHAFGQNLYSWRAVRTLAVLVQAVTAYPWWRAREVVLDDGRPVVTVVVDEVGLDLRTLSLAVLSLDRLGSTTPSLPGVEAIRERLLGSGAGRLPSDLPLPEELEPLPGSLGAQRLMEVLTPRSDACAWAWMSNGTEPEPAGDAALLEFFGYRRRNYRLGSAGYVSTEGQRAIRAYSWATAETSPDRILAIRQVVSLYEADELPRLPEDVVRGAEPLYQALRAGEVAAVLDSQRQARSTAVEAARGSADAAQEAAKSAAERTIASLAAVAGVAVANASSVVSVATARGLAVGIVALFAFLAIWTIVVEGPGMCAPINSFKSDLSVIGHLLSQADQSEVLKMRALATAEHAVIRVRIAAPLVYVAGAVITLIVADRVFALHI